MEAGREVVEPAATAEPGPEALIAAIAERADRTAFAALFARFAPRVKAYLQRAGASGSDAEEIAQEVMVTVWRKAAQFDPSKASAATWIYTIARNRRIDLVRRERRPELDPDDPALVPEPARSAEAAVSDRQQAMRVRASLAALPPDQRQVVQLAFVEDRAHSAIAELLDVPLGTVKSRLRLAFRKLRLALEET